MVHDRSLLDNAPPLGRAHLELCPPGPLFKIAGTGDSKGGSFTPTALSGRKNVVMCWKSALSSKVVRRSWRHEEHCNIKLSKSLPGHTGA